MTHSAFRIAVLLALALAGEARAGAGAVVSLRAAADLPGAHYTLGDIADIDSADAALRRRLAAIAIGAVPRLGYAESVSRAQVEALVRQEIAASGLAWRGAPEVRIRGRGQKVAAEALFDAAVRALHAALSGQYDAIELRPVNGYAGIGAPAGALQLEARVPAPQRLAGRMSALVDVSVDGEFYTTVPVWFAVRATRPALLARVPLRPGAALRAEDFQVATVDVAANAAAALGRNAALDGLRLRRGLEPGVALNAGHVEARPPVARDEKVAVRVVQGAVTIETTGRALADARLGEVTRVRNTSTNESYAARVVGDGVVLVSAR